MLRINKFSGALYQNNYVATGYKLVLTILFSLLFVTSVSADARLSDMASTVSGYAKGTSSDSSDKDDVGTLKGAVTDTSITKGTVTVSPENNDSDEVITKVPANVIEDVNKLREAPFGVTYTFTFTVQENGSYQDYTYKKTDNRLAIYFCIALMTSFLLFMIFETLA